MKFTLPIQFEEDTIFSIKRCKRKFLSRLTFLKYDCANFSYIFTKYSAFDLINIVYRTYAHEVQNQAQSTLLFKVTVYTVNGLLLLISQFNCIRAYPKSRLLAI